MLAKKGIFYVYQQSSITGPGGSIPGKYNTAVQGVLPFTSTTNMLFRKISRDVKLAAVNLYEHEHLSLEQILDCVGFSETTFWRILKLRKVSGDVVQHTYGVRRPPRILHLEDLHYL